ncbi:MAG TPA: hypothetical protein VE288_09270 [Rubrobacteraceae bacterium]|nr:hypothetical protein [Rubrobacteraceae bacterium]
MVPIQRSFGTFVDRSKLAVMLLRVRPKRGDGSVPIDQAKVGEVAAELMDILETTYGEDAEISAVMLITAVTHDNGAKTTVHHNASPGMPVHEGLGLLMFVQSLIARGAR